MEGLELEIVQIAENAWRAFLGLEIRPQSEGAPEVPSDIDGLSGCIDLSGEWKGAVILSCSRQLARGAAAAMFDVAPDEVTEDQIIDAIGELSNIIAGNIKARLPGPSEISLPVVVPKLNPAQAEPGAGSRTHVAFDCDGQPLWIHVSERVG